MTGEVLGQKKRWEKPTLSNRERFRERSLNAAWTRSWDEGSAGNLGWGRGTIDRVWACM